MENKNIPVPLTQKENKTGFSALSSFVISLDSNSADETPGSFGLYYYNAAAEKNAGGDDDSLTSQNKFYV